MSVAILTTMAFTAQAQFKITPKIGYTTSTRAVSKNFRDAIEKEGGKIGYVSGFSFGAAFELGLGNTISLQPEILYSQKGAFAKINLFDIPIETTEKLNYLEVPVLVKASFGDEDGFRFFVYAGPYVGYALNGKGKVAITFESETQPGKFETITGDYKIKFGEKPANSTNPASLLEDVQYYSKDDVNRLDIGAYAGAGISIPVGPGALSLEGRYGYGFTDYQKDPSGIRSKENLKSQTRSISVFLGYAIPLGGN